MTLPLVVITGLSGAGRTTALKALEDQGYQAIDNLPLLMMPALVENIINNSTSNAPVVVGLRSIDFTAPQVEALIKDLRASVLTLNFLTKFLTGVGCGNQDAQR